MINERFYDVTPELSNKAGVIPTVVAQGTTTTTQTGAGTSTVTGSSFTVKKGQFKPGTTFRFTLGGSKSGTNAAMKVHLKVGGTQVMSLTAPDATAVDWKAEFIITEYGNFAKQKTIGKLHTNATVGTNDYAASTVDVTNDIVLLAQIESQNAGDNVLCEYVLVEYWVK